MTPLFYLFSVRCSRVSMPAASQADVGILSGPFRDINLNVTIGVNMQARDPAVITLRHRIEAIV